jgi:hypothetical protein
MAQWWQRLFDGIAQALEILHNMVIECEQSKILELTIEQLNVQMRKGLMFAKYV